MARRRLIFFPAADPSRVTAAYRLAAAGAGAGFEEEVRLAGDAMLVADPAYVATMDGGDALRRDLDGAVTDGVTCPCARSQCGIHEDQLAAIGAQLRSLADILVEVAEGRSVLVHL
jgi:hypothetical protein